MQHQDVLLANDAFYRAFAARDVKAMDAVWARHAPVACIHPGWGALVGRQAVMESWSRILGGPGAPKIACRDARSFVAGDLAWVICFEVIDDGYLIATNLFVREGDAWRMVHHQAGPTTERPRERPAEPSIH